MSRLLSSHYYSHPFRSRSPRHVAPRLRLELLSKHKTKSFSSTFRKRVQKCLNSENESDDIDIDKLAKQLSKAARHRRFLSQPPFEERKEDFDPEDFEVIRTLGYLTVKVTKPHDLSAESSEGSTPSRNAAIIAHKARYYGRPPFGFPTLVLLKEYLYSAKTIAENEFRALTCLTTLPEDQWEVFLQNIPSFHRRYAFRQQHRMKKTKNPSFSYWDTFEDHSIPIFLPKRPSNDAVFGSFINGKN